VGIGGGADSVAGEFGDEEGDFGEEGRDDVPPAGGRLVEGSLGSCSGSDAHECGLGIAVDECQDWAGS